LHQWLICHIIQFLIEKQGVQGRASEAIGFPMLLTGMFVAMTVVRG